MAFATVYSTIAAVTVEDIATTKHITRTSIIRISASTLAILDAHTIIAATVKAIFVLLAYILLVAILHFIFTLIFCNLVLPLHLLLPHLHPSQ